MSIYVNISVYTYTSSTKSSIKISRCTETHKRNEGKCFSYLSSLQSVSINQ